MPFAHDTEVALLATAALVNTHPSRADGGVEGLASPDDLDAFVEAHRYTGSRTRDHAELEAVHAVRERLAGLWQTDDETAVVDLVNGLLREHRALPQLVRHDGWSWHIHAVEPSRPLADRIAVEAALAVLDLVRGDELSRLRRCDAEDCDAVLVDLSRNRSKRYCDVGNCANRAHVAAYRARKAARRSR
ncbi:CGNR zinc finger domain-containing protein [Euzebya sp.]|uniref:CGNR zinc finger domain-containing protein n=1 Tax=Euzebya sp. TaxID=1971409 RepID=UPI003512BF95